MLRALFRLLSPAGARSRLSVLIFHRVVAEADPLFDDVPDARHFASMMSWVRAWFNVLPLPEAAERLKAGDLPERALVITFDDGYADNEEIALPILRRLQLPATFFISTAFLDGGGLMWNDEIVEAIRACRANELDLTRLGLGIHTLGAAAQRRRVIDDLLVKTMHLEPGKRADCVAAIVEATGARSSENPMMTSDQVRSLFAAGMTIGGHTVTHPILARLAPEVARREIVDGRERLAEIIGDRIEVFAYPSGRPGRDYGPEHARMVRDCGFKAGVSTAWGVASAGADHLQLPRFTPWDRSRGRFGLRLAQNLQRTRYATA